MKRMWLLILSICALTLSACGKNDDYSKVLAGSWYHDGSSTPAFILYDDGTCEIAGEYGEGTWEIDENKQLVLYNYYGESEMAPIISIEDGCLSIGDEQESIKLYNEPTNTDGSGNMPLEELGSDETKEEIEDTNIEEKEEILAQDVYFFSNSNYDDYVEMKEKTVLCGYGTSADSKNEYLGIINNELQFIPCALEYSYDYSFFSDGYAYINYNSERFVIIDADGNVVYESPTDATYKILCGGNGYYYVEKKVSGFDVNEVSYWIMSVEGAWTAVDFVSEIVASNYRYQGNGLLQLGAFIFVKMEDCSIYYTSSDDKYDPDFVGFTENDELIWLHSTSYEGEVYITDKNNNTRQIAVTGGWGSAKYGDGLVFINDRDGNTRYIDLDGDIIIDLSQYEVVDFQTGGRFYDGYAALDIIGQDGYHYLAVIDKSGNFIFDPIQFSSYSNLRGIGMFSNGYIPILKKGL